ncbi:hypothetical protein FRC98_19950 [Lujinxingia vulgaris]|uniref:Uncharacterized protein n=1 Tax=Lujinxingia vulgaris TaxID=2600176 RepID=A0A5C6X5J1_9DELT|nr:hypothetical protein [Lujinxingia vulgaris]TXD33968.1 hypothetical protein FRC98_19950 [Lujinxingia vulgaris]
MSLEHHPKALSTRILMLVVLTWGFAGCHVLSESAPESGPGELTDDRTRALTQALDLRWSALMADVSVEPQQSSEAWPTMGYEVSVECPLIYDFEMTMPLGAATGRQSTGRVELRAHPREEGAFEFANRATGLYPVHRGIRHPGKEWWHEDLEPVRLTQNERGLLVPAALPAPWSVGGPMLSLAALFPPVPQEDAARPWPALLPSDADGDSDGEAAQMSSALNIRVEDRVLLGEERALVLAAEGGPDDLRGRYLVSERGRVVAAALVLPRGDQVASASLRLTGACEGQRLPPAPQANDARSQMIEAWTRFSNAAREAQWERALHLLDPALRDTHGDDAITALLADHLSHFGPAALGSLSPSSPLSEDDGRVTLQLQGRTFPDEDGLVADVITEVVAIRTERGLRIKRVRTTLDPQGEPRELLDVSANTLRSSASNPTEAALDEASDAPAEGSAPTDAPAAEGSEVR